MVNPGTPKISADLVRALLRSRGKISGATLTCAAAALLGCPEATDDEKVRFYVFLIKRLEQIAQNDECRANVHKLVRYPDEVKADDAAARAVQLRRSVEKFMRTGCAMGGDYYVGKDIDLIALFSSDEWQNKNFVLLREWGDDYFAFRFISGAAIGAAPLGAATGVESMAAAAALRHRAPGRPHGGVVQLDGVPHDDVDELGGARAAPRRARRKGAGWPPPRARVGGCATRARDHTSCQGPRPFWARRRTHEAAAQLRHRRPCAQRDRFDGESGPCNRVRGVTRWPADRTATRQLARVAQAQDAAFSATEGRRSVSRQPGVGPEEVETPSRCRSDDKL